MVKTTTSKSSNTRPTKGKKRGKPVLARAMIVELCSISTTSATVAPQITCKSKNIKSNHKGDLWGLYSRWWMRSKTTSSSKSNQKTKSTFPFPMTRFEGWRNGSRIRAFRKREISRAHTCANQRALWSRVAVIIRRSSAKSAHIPWLNISIIWRSPATSCNNTS